jgi:ABC-2 type transport system ATP-binding protein
MLSVQRLSRSFGSLEVLKDLDFSVAPGERVAVRGHNGAGKTTLLRCIAGSVTPDAGDVLVSGHRAGTLAARRLTGTSLSQERSFYLRLTGHENLLFFARLRGVARSDAARFVDPIEEELDLREIASRAVHSCSTGMIQQLSFARALLGGPLLLLDEPTRSLDGGATQRLWAALDRRPELSLMIATHRDEDVARCNRTLALD